MNQQTALAQTCMGVNWNWYYRVPLWFIMTYVFLIRQIQPGLNVICSTVVLSRI